MSDDKLNAMWYYAVGSGDPAVGNAHLRFARDVLAAQPAPAVPDGWVMVPREPTHAMLLAYTKCITQAGFSWCRHQWSAMLAAAPAVPAARPMTDEQVLDAISDCKGIGGRIIGDGQLIELARAIEAHHGITGDSNG